MATVLHTDPEGQLQKLQVYMDYFITMTALKHDFDIGPAGRPNGYSEADRNFPVLNAGIRRLWMDVPVLTFKGFCTTPPAIDNGTDWKERGYAQRIRQDQAPIHKWVHH